MSTAKLFVAVAALALLAASVEAAPAFRIGAAPQCVDNITNGVEAVINAVEDIAKAVVDCPKKGNTAQCIADISATGNQLAAAAQDISLAVPACGGQGSQCATDLIALTKDLTGAASDVSLAVKNCESKEYLRCVGDVIDISDFLAKTIESIKAAAKVCGAKAAAAQAKPFVPKMVRRLGAPDPCVDNISAAVTAAAVAAKDVASAVVDCPKKNNTGKCIADIEDAAAQLAAAGEDISLAVTACGGRGSACATNLLLLTKALSQDAEDITNAVTNCKDKDYLKCLTDVVKGSEMIGNVLKDLVNSIKTCSAKRVAGAVVFAVHRLRAPQACVDNITAAVEQLIGAGEGVADAVAQCKNNTAQCISDITKVASDLAAAGSDVTQAVTACGGQGSKCASDLLNLAKDLSNAASEVSGAIAQCESKDYFKCVADVIDVAEFIEKSVGAIYYAAKQCGAKLF